MPVSELTPPIRGLVVDRSDRPVPQAAVTLFVRRERQHFFLDAESPRASADDTTDSKGRFGFDSCERRGLYDVRVRADGFAPKTVRAIAAGVDLRVVLDRGNALAGRVVAAKDGSPVEGARLILRDVPPDEPDSEGDETVAGAAASAADGSFRFTCAPLGLARVDAEAVGFAPSSAVSWTDEGQPPAPIEIRLEDELRLTGVVLDAESDSPVASAVVVASSWDATRRLPPLRRSTIADDSGRFELAGLRRTHFEGPNGIALAVPIAYEIEASSGGRSGKARVEVHARSNDEPGPIVIRVARPIGVALRVTVLDDDGNPVEGAHVSFAGFSSIDGRSAMGEQESASDGVARFDAFVPDVPVTVWARKTGFLTAIEESIAGPDSGLREVVCRLSRSSVRTRVRVRWRDGRPAGGATVFLVSADAVRDDPAWESGRTLAIQYPHFNAPRQEAGRTDGAGLFVTEALPAGLYAMEVDHADAADGRVSLVDVVPPVAEVSVDLDFGGAITGAVRLLDGTPVDRVLVLAVPSPPIAAQRPRVSRVASTDGRGCFRIGGIDPTVPHLVVVNTRFSIGGQGSGGGINNRRDGVMAGESVEFRLVPIVDVVR